MENNDLKTLKTIVFFDTVSANSRKTLVSQRISTPYRIRRIVASFALNTNRTLKLTFHVSQDDNAPTSSKPTDFSLLSEYGHVDYLAGDDEQKNVNNDFIVNYSGSYIKVHANNTDGFEHTIDCFVEIEIQERS